MSYAQNDSLSTKENTNIKPFVYLRSGIAESKGGEIMADFKAPGALSHYRLGNEANTYGEFGLIYHQDFKNSENSLDVVMMLSGYAGFGEKESFKLDNVAQFYAKFNHVFNGADIWAGRRYYFRQDYHMIDYFWYNPGQDANFGFGIENIRSKNHRDNLAFAVFSFENKDVSSILPNNDEINSKTNSLTTFNLEAKWSDIPIYKNGSLMIFTRAGKRRSNKRFGYKDANGFGIGLAHTQNNILKGKATNSFQINIKKGVNVVQNLYTGLPVFEKYGNEEKVLYDLSKNYAFEVSNSFYYEDEKNVAINALVLYRYEDRGTAPIILRMENFII